MGDNEHVFMGNTRQGGYVCYCLHCGQSYTPAIPCPMDLFVKTIKWFEETHRDCQPGPYSVPGEEVVDRFNLRVPDTEPAE